MAESALGAISNVGTAQRPGGSNQGLAANRDYRVVIDVTGDEALLQPPGGAARKIFPIEANLPERFHIELTSQWAMPFNNATAGSAAGGIAGALGVPGSGFIGAAADAALGAAGIGSKAKSMGYQTWESTSPLQFNLDLVFYANENTEREIRERHLALLKLCAPSTAMGGEVLIAPGPRLIDGGRAGRSITLYIGRYLQIENVIINSVGSDVVTMMDENGIPVAMTINIGVTTWNAFISGEELDKMFYGGGAP